MSTIDLQQQSIQGDVSEETKTVKIPGIIWAYPPSFIDRPKSMVDDLQTP